MGGCGGRVGDCSQVRASLSRLVHARLGDRGRSFIAISLSHGQGDRGWIGSLRLWLHSGLRQSGESLRLWLLMSGLKPGPILRARAGQGQQPMRGSFTS
jgi:hypothetical protein